jgi:hypothetical protein
MITFVFVCEGQEVKIEMSSMSDLNTLLSTEIPEGLQSLTDSNVNLARVAEYCESNYFQVHEVLIIMYMI